MVIVLADMLWLVIYIIQLVEFFYLFCSADSRALYSYTKIWGISMTPSLLSFYAFWPCSCSELFPQYSGIDFVSLHRK